jgi:hypothetical protein
MLVPKIPIFYTGFQVAFRSKYPFNTYDYLIQNLTPDVLMVILLVPFIINCNIEFLLIV